MLSKKKTFIALIVKLLFCFVYTQAQNSYDSTKQKNAQLPVFSNIIYPLKKTAFPNQLPGNFYAKQLPFFCNKELQVQKAIGIPIKFRVGSVEYCDKLEGKNR